MTSLGYLVYGASMPFTTYFGFSISKRTLTLHRIKLQTLFSTVPTHYITFWESQFNTFNELFGQK